MSDGGYKIRNKEGIHFVTFATVEWVDVFTRKEYRDILIESLKYCKQEKGLVIYAWCIMSNHVHLVISAKGNNPSDVLGDFKKFTSKKIVQAIQESHTESRKDWMLEIFRRAGETNSRNKNHQFWRQDNQPKEMFTENFTMQKLDYIHNNPVEAGIVEKAEEYVYSSSKDYYVGKNVGMLPIEFLE
jgi:REP element-mobilizing transposase RayT